MSEDDDQQQPGDADAPSATESVADAADADADPSKRTRLIIAAVVGAALLLSLVLYFVTRGGDDADEPVDRSTTTVELKTTVLDPDVAEIATVKESVDLVEVLAEEPESWARSASAVLLDVPETSDVPVDAPMADSELPTIEAPIMGRYAVDDGWEFTNPGPYLPPQPMTFLVTERRDAWVKVLIPVRPNHTEGWVRLDDVDISTTEYRITISLADHTLVATEGDEVIAETKVVIGSPFTQTPTGLFYVTDKVPYENPDGVYGPIALATNGYSEWMDEFDTGVPVVAMHGTSQPDQVGQSISNGCIRLPNDVIQLLADTVPLGTPVVITA